MTIVASPKAAAASSGGRRPKSVRALARRNAQIAFLFVLPAFALFVAFRFGPSLAGIALSLVHYDISGDIAWRGLKNFQRLVADPVFWKALATTGLYTVICVPTALTVSTVMALGVRRAFRGARFFRSVFFLPVITSLVLAGSIFTWIFSGNGPWSQLMAPIGLGGSWLADTTLVIPALVIIGVWSRFGYGTLILVAALQEVPRELEEAALIDGATSWQRIRTIVLPTIRPALFFLAVIETTEALQVFDVIYITTGGGPAHASYSLIYLLYDQGFKYLDYGYSAAIGVALFLLTLAIALLQRLVIGRSA